MCVHVHSDGCGGSDSGSDGEGGEGGEGGGGKKSDERRKRMFDHFIESEFRKRRRVRLYSLLLCVHVVVCVTLLASFFLPSASLIDMYIIV